MDDILTKCFEPFEMAMASDSDDLAAYCLDTLQKVVSIYKFSGRLYDPKNRQRLFVDYLIISISKCYEKFYNSTKVEIQLLKLLVVLVTTSGSQIHGDSLMTAIRLCYNIHTITSSRSNQNLAYGSLLTMMAHVYKRATEIEFPFMAGYFIDREIFLANIAQTEEEKIRSALDMVVDATVLSEQIQANYYIDALNIFKIFSKLLTKSFAESNSTNSLHSKENLSKKLSLKLIYRILINYQSLIATPAFVEVFLQIFLLFFLEKNCKFKGYVIYFLFLTHALLQKSF